MIEFKQYKLGDIAEIIVSTVDKKSKPDQKEVRLCNFVDVYKNWAITHDLYDGFMVATASDIEIERFKIKKGQVAFTKDSETRDDIGIATYIAEDFDDVVLGYHTALVTPNEDIILGKYLNAFMHSKYILKYFEMNATGSGMRYTLSLETLNDIPILAPSLKDQEKIGNFFSAIDKKITNNRKANAVLEALIKQIYDYWFIQFDFPDNNSHPYKTSGGEMVYNPALKRSIPKGWTDATLGDFCQMYQPKTLSLKELSSDGKYRVYGANGFIGYYDEYNHSDSEVAIACRGNSCGTVNRTMPFSWITGNAMVMKMRDNAIHNEFIAQSVPYINIQGAISGSGQPQLTRENLNPIKIIKPTKDVLASFSKLVKPLIKLRLNNQDEIDRLVKYKNDMLPLIMTGQVVIDK